MMSLKEIFFQMLESILTTMAKDIRLHIKSCSFDTITSLSSTCTNLNSFIYKSKQLVLVKNSIALITILFYDIIFPFGALLICVMIFIMKFLLSIWAILPAYIHKILDTRTLEHILMHVLCIGGVY